MLITRQKLKNNLHNKLNKKKRITKIRINQIIKIFIKLLKRTILNVSFVISRTKIF